MVERFNGCIAGILRTHRFRDGENLEDTIKRYVKLYNNQLTQKALEHVTPASPVELMEKWQRKMSDLFSTNIRNYQGHDNHK